MNIKHLLPILLILTSNALHAAPNVIASIAPLQSLAAMVTAGITEPALIIPPSQSPHDFVLRPSSARAIASADLIVWLGAQGEPNLARALTHKAQIIDTSTIDSIVRHPTRDAGLKTDQHSHASALDPHIWLSPKNAVQILLAIRDRLIQIDPTNAQRYSSNAQIARDRIEAMHKTIQLHLSGINHLPFIVMHDSLQYFEQTYHLTNLGSLGAHDGYMPGVRRLSQFRNLILEENITCILTDAGGSDQLLHPLNSTGNLHSVSADVLGIGLAPAKQAYFDLMIQLTNNIRKCLSPNAG